MSGPLRSLLVSWGIETKGIEKLDRVESKLDTIFDKVGKVATAIATAFAVSEIGSFIAGQIEAGRSLDLTAEKLGVSVDELERFRFAAGQAGVDVEVADRALMLLNRTTGEAEDGNKRAAKAFAELGISTTGADGKIKPFGQRIGELADAFAKMQDPAKRTDTAMKVFGRGGAALIPLLDKGAAGLKSWSEEFDALGGGIGEAFAEEAKAAGAEVKKFDFVLSVLKTRIVSAILPSFVKFTELGIRFVAVLKDFAVHTYAVRTALIAFGAVSAYALAPLLAGIAPILTAFTALYILFDDFYTMMMGGKSVIGDFIDSLYGKGAHETFVKDVKEQFAAFITWVRDVAIPFCKDLGASLKWAFVNALPELREFAGYAKDIWESFKGAAIALGLIRAPTKPPVSEAERKARETEDYYGDPAPQAGEHGRTSGAFYSDDAAHRPATVAPFYVPRRAELPFGGRATGAFNVADEDNLLPDRAPDLTRAGSTAVSGDMHIHVATTANITASGVSADDVKKVIQDTNADAIRRAIENIPTAPGGVIPSASPGGR